MAWVSAIGLGKKNGYVSMLACLECYKQACRSGNVTILPCPNPPKGWQSLEGWSIDKRPPDHQGEVKIETFMPDI